VIVAVLLSSWFGEGQEVGTKSVKEILGMFTESYVEKTQNLNEISFGFLIDDEEWWTVSIDEQRAYLVHKGKPSKPTFYFTTDRETLVELANGTMHAYTAMAKARATDKTPMDFAVMEGYEPDAQFDLLQFIFHYFTIGSIEKITLGKEFARIVHGGYAIPLVYAKGLRTAWYRIEKGMIINEDPKDQTNPFPTLVVATKGKGIAEIDGQEFSFSGGEAYYIPEHVTHVFWTDSDEGLEFIIIMYGEGA
jgi:hypothetical protein